MIERSEGHCHEGMVLRTLCRRIFDWKVKTDFRMLNVCVQVYELR